MSYMARLKAMNSQKALPEEPSKPSKAAFEPFEGSLPPCKLENEDADALAERAAIVQEGAGVPADWADEFARLDALAVPRGVSAAAWRGMVDSAGRFLDQWGSNAAALGWTAGELIGFDPDAPMNRRDRRGAALYLVGAVVLAVTAEAITIRARGAVKQVYRHPTSGVPAWQAGL